MMAYLGYVSGGKVRGIVLKVEVKSALLKRVFCLHNLLRIQHILNPHSCTFLAELCVV